MIPRARFVPLILGVALLSGMAGVPARAASPILQCSGSWHLLRTPTHHAFQAFNAVSALTSSEAWAVGAYAESGLQPLMEHWDGARWRERHGPQLGAPSKLDGVWSRSKSDVWAVGTQEGASQLTLIEHWDGTSWSVSDSPSPGSSNWLEAVSGSSSTDVWAVGGDTDPYGIRTLAEH